MGSGVGIRPVGYFDCAGGGQVVVENNIAYVGHMRSPHEDRLKALDHEVSPRIAKPKQDHAYARSTDRSNDLTEIEIKGQNDAAL